MIHAQQAADGTCLQYAEVTAVIRRASGTVEQLVLDSYESDAHRTYREAAGIALPEPVFNDLAAAPAAPAKPKRAWWRRWLAVVGIGAVVGCLTLAPCEIAKAAALPIALGASVITNSGQAINTNLISGLGGTVPKFLAWGTGAGTAAITDTTLFTESTDEARTSGTVTRVTTTVTNDTLQVVGAIVVATSNKTITNVGTFDVVTTSSGNIHFKSDFTGQALLIGDSITFTIKTKYA